MRGHYGTRYMFATIQQSEISAAPIRVNYSFSPDMSLELWAEPFAASGTFSRFGELPEAQSFDLREYGTDGTTIEEVYRPGNGVELLRRDRWRTDVRPAQRGLQHGLTAFESRPPVGTAARQYFVRGVAAEPVRQPVTRDPMCGSGTCSADSGRRDRNALAIKNELLDSFLKDRPVRLCTASSPAPSRSSVLPCSQPSRWWLR